MLEGKSQSRVDLVCSKSDRDGRKVESIVGMIGNHRERDLQKHTAIDITSAYHCTPPPSLPQSSSMNIIVVLLAGLVQLGKVATASGSPLPCFNVVPVDYVVDAVVSLLEFQNWKIWQFAPLHLCSSGMSTSKMCAWLRSAGYQLEEVDVETFCCCVKSLDERNPLFQFRSQLSKTARTSVVSMPQVITNRVSQLKLKTSGNMTKSGLQRSVEFLLSTAPD